MHLKKILSLTTAVFMLITAGCSSATTSSATASPQETTTESSSVTSPPLDSTDPEMPVATLPQPDPVQATVSLFGTIGGIEGDCVTVVNSAAPDDPELALVAVLTDETILVDAPTGKPIEPEDLKSGMNVNTFVSADQTRSVPPQSECKAMIVNIPENGLGSASYIYVTETSEPDNGNLLVLNQNGDLWLTIPQNLTIQMLGTGEEVPATDIDPGTVLIAWFDEVLETYPMQATATKVLYCIAPAVQDS